MPTKKTTKKQATVSSTSATNSKATKKKRATKSAAANNPSSVDSAEKTKNRKLTPNYKSFQLQKRIKHPDALPRARHMFISAVKHMWRYKRLFLGVFAVYLIGSVVLVQSLQNAESAQFVRDAIEEAIEGGLGRILGGTAVLSLLASGATSAPTDVAGVYQMIFFLVITLATVWSLRQTFGERRPQIRDAFYQGMYPLVPFLLVLLVIGLQLIPFMVGGWLFTVVIAGGLAVNFVEQFIWGFLFFLLALLSIYMIASSLFAMYIVTLPDMRPLQSLRSARELVRFRRWAVIRKVLFMPLALLLIGVVVLLPVVLLTPGLAPALVLAYSLASVMIGHGFMYTMYRELL
jgi:hypothetical protein